MAKHPTSSRVHRGDQPPDDAFVASIKRAYDWGRANRRVVTTGLVVVLVIALGSIWYIAQKRQTEREAAARFNAVQQTLASGNVQLAIRDLQSYLQRFGETESGSQARILLAGILLEQDRPQEAMEALGRLPRDLERPYGLAAARLQAAAQEESGDHDAAADNYVRIADEARFEFERREALADAARVHLQAGQPDRAADLFDRVVQSFDEGEQGRGYYEMWLAEAQAQAREPTRAAPPRADTTAGVAPAEDPGNG